LPKRRQIVIVVKLLKLKVATNKKAFWDKKNPNKKSAKLSLAEKKAAQARSSKAGRPYPNLVDNAWASRRG
jgi:hypothetical protein